MLPGDGAANSEFDLESIPPYYRIIILNDWSDDLELAFSQDS